MNSHLRAVLFALIAAFALALPGAAQAASGPDITVQIEGVDATIVEQRDVSLDYNKFSPPEPWPGSTAPANSIGAAIETSLNDVYGVPAPTAPGWWDRQPFVSEIKGEALIWPSGTWSFWVNDTYTNKGAMDGGDQWGLDYGDDVLISGGGSIGEWPDPTRPERLPVDLAGTGIDDVAQAVPVNTPFSLNVTAWMPQEGDTDMPPGPSDRQRASFPMPGDDFTVVAMPADTLYDSTTVSGVEIGTAKSNSAGDATLSINQTGEAWVKAVRENSDAAFGASPLGAQGRSEAHEICVYDLNSGDCGTPVFTPASSVDAGQAPVGGVGSPVSLDVAAPNHANEVTRVRVFGPDASDFLVSAGNCVDEFVGQGDSCQIKVRLAPTVEGERNATLRVVSDSESLPRDISLTGVGIAGTNPSTGSAKLGVRVNPGKARVRRGKTVKVTVRTTNTGDAPAGNVLTCLRVPSGFRSGRLCGKRAKLAAGKTVSFSFTVRAKRKAPLGALRNAQARSTADGLGITTARMKLGARR